LAFKRRVSSSHTFPQTATMERHIMRKRHGFTLIELLVVIAIITLLMGILLPALANARRAAQTVKDSTQLAQIHKGMVTFSRQFDGIFPRPGRINPLAFNGVETPGLGSEDISKNTTQNVYSACIAQNFFDAELVVSPAEVNGRVITKNDYNHERYSPINDIYWDGDNTGVYDGWNAGEFAADVDDISNTSYSHSTLTGKRGRDQWRDNLDSEWTMLSNRGVENGSYSPAIYNASLTLQIHAGRRSWEGNVCYADGHINFEDAFTPDGITFLNDSNVMEADNLFLEQSTDTNGATGYGTGYDRLLILYEAVQGTNTINFADVKFD
jgi:prepilin-type N-terminal cleavage/methylation domain-containing protein/prepilin-type processing-associated H-X9-DG protein